MLIKRILVSAATVFSLTQMAIACPTGNRLSVDKMNQAMVDTFEKSSLWFHGQNHQNPRIDFRIKWTHSASAELPSFVTDYRDSRNRRVAGPGGFATRVLEVTGKKGNGYIGWLYIKVGAKKVDEAMMAINPGVNPNATKKQKEAIEAFEDEYIRVRQSSIRLVSAGGFCKLETITDRRYKNKDGSGFNGIAQSYIWQKEL